MDAVRVETRGRKPLPDDAKRVVRIVTRLTKEEAALVESQRGEMLRSEWLREAALGNAPVPVPAINREAWADLGRALSNLNQIARHLNGGRSADQIALEQEIASLRKKITEVPG